MPSDSPPMWPIKLRRSFFKDFAFPVLLSEDPRYYRMAHGPFRKRLLHGLGHSFVAYRVDGTRMFNSSEWLGTSGQCPASAGARFVVEKTFGYAQRC